MAGGRHVRDRPFLRHNPFVQENQRIDEIWKDIPDTDYSVSSFGRIASRKKGKWRLLRPATSSSGYVTTVIFRNAARQTVGVHRLVAQAFLGNTGASNAQVNHVNGDKTDNRAANLEWVTGSANIRHRFDVLKKGNRRGEAHAMAKLTETKVREIRARLAAGESQVRVAASYGVDPHQVSKISRGQNWGWVRS